MREIKRKLMNNGTMIGFLLALSLLLCVNSAFSFSQSPIINKFVTTLPGLGPAGANKLVADQSVFGQYLPLATKKSVLFRDVMVDKYTLGVGEFQERMHPDLPYLAGKGTHFLGYYDLINPDHKYLAGVIVAKRGTPVMLSVQNNLPNQLPSQQIIPIDPHGLGGRYDDRRRSGA
ncbi:MAG TPA: hypothetical protein VMT62_09330 [Syntrophorhabdaceae bacterium]|nr:hypothetical protein [Syntrophorhabdaceae bacterium]